MDISFNFKTLDELIEVAENYRSRRKRKRTSSYGLRDVEKKPVIPYNSDLERLSYCIEPLKKLNDLVGMDDLKKDRNFVLDVVKINGNALKHASADLQSDPEIIKAAVLKGGLSLESAPKKLLNRITKIDKNLFQENDKVDKVDEVDDEIEEPFKISKKGLKDL